MRKVHSIRFVIQVTAIMIVIILLSGVHKYLYILLRLILFDYK